MTNTPDFNTRVVDIDESLEQAPEAEAQAIPLSPADEKKIKAKKEYRFDLQKLEGELDVAYKDFRKFESDDTRTKLFMTIRDLAYAILMVGKFPRKAQLNLEEKAYEYGLYLFERLVTGSFRPEDSHKFIDKMPWQNYIDININHILHKNDDGDAWLDLVEDLEFLVDATRLDECNMAEAHQQKTNQETLSRELHQALSIFYSDAEIHRLLPISVHLIFSNPKYLINDEMPKDVKDFSLVLISVAKRIASKNNMDDSSRMKKSELIRMLQSSVRSTVFLSSVVNSSFMPKELLLSLDIDSLYRLCQISGGKRIRIPTQRELNTLVGAVVTVSKMIADGKNYKESVNESKKEFDLVFSHQINTETFVAKVIKSMQTFGKDEKTDPLISVILMSVKSLEKLFDKVAERADGTDPETLLHTYKLMQESLSSLTNIMNQLSKSVDKT